MFGTAARPHHDRETGLVDPGDEVAVDVGRLVFMGLAGARCAPGFITTPDQETPVDVDE
jgi:hypothetical protein